MNYLMTWKDTLGKNSKLRTWQWVLTWNADWWFHVQWSGSFFNTLLHAASEDQDRVKFPTRPRTCSITGSNSIDLVCCPSSSWTLSRHITSKHHLLKPHWPNTCGVGVNTWLPTGLNIHSMIMRPVTHSKIMRQCQKNVMEAARHPFAHTVSLMMPINC